MTNTSNEIKKHLLHIESLDLEAQGIAHKEDGKVVFVEGALPFETVTANIFRKKNNWEQGTLAELIHESSQRVQPGCTYFGMHAGSCGGCKMQHLNTHAQVSVKQRVLEDNLWHLGKVKPEHISRPLHGPDWGYRYRARLSVRYVVKKSKVLIGFHERKSRYVADIESCKVLPPHVSNMLLPLRALIESLDAREQCPQIEMACGDSVTALILRHLVPLSTKDLTLLNQFGNEFNVQWWLQPKGPDSISLLKHEADAKDTEHLSYGLPEFGLVMRYRPTDFTQVNPFINQAMISRAISALGLKSTDFVIDWFCGIGNFTLPIATKAKQVVGVEGSRSLLDWAQENCSGNSSAFALKAPQVEFIDRNLFEMDSQDLMGFGSANKWLIDPPREGAFALVKSLAEIPALQVDQAVFAMPSRIVYISCNPATLARDAEVLVHQAGYKCVSTGILNMFPHTAHVESMAVFELP